MTDSPVPYVPVDSAILEDPKLRPCLRCQTMFRSEWAGERICSRCKGSAAWRKGAPFRSSSSGH